MSNSNLVDEILELEAINARLVHENDLLHKGEGLAQVKILEVEIENQKLQAALLEEQRHSEMLKTIKDELKHRINRLLDSLKVLDSRCTELEQALLNSESTA